MLKQVKYFKDLYKIRLFYGRLLLHFQVVVFLSWEWERGKLKSSEHKTAVDVPKSSSVNPASFCHLSNRCIPLFVVFSNVQWMTFAINNVMSWDNYNDERKLGASLLFHSFSTSSSCRLHFNFGWKKDISNRIFDSHIFLFRIAKRHWQNLDLYVLQQLILRAV